MDFDTFRASLSGSPPPDLSLPLRVLGHDGSGEWDTAHDIAQDMKSSDGSWLHAYLHRREGDLSNAAYWYRDADRRIAEGSLDDEWEALCRHFL